MAEKVYDYVIIGSGFGGSVSALRLAEKGYSVLVIEKGKRLTAKDFPKTNWNLRKWLWEPKIGLKGLFKITFFRHVAVLSGVGVGGGSLVYANTLPIPKSEFFTSGNWKGLADWENELKPFYETAKRMLGATTHPYESQSETAMKELSKRLGIPNAYSPTDVAVYFGEEGKTVRDPYFEGEGPDRTGCNQCGGCMLGCRFDAKNTLDKNYLYLAEKKGVEILAEKLVTDVHPINEDGSEGYEISYKNSLAYFPKKGKVSTKHVVFAGGVLGTVNLLLKLKETSLPNLSEKVGEGIRTNSESLIGVTSFKKDAEFSKGIAIGSIVEIDGSRHLEPVKYSAGSGAWRLLMAPMVSGSNVFVRFFKMFKDLITDPIRNFKAFTIDDWSKRSQILLYMESIDSTLKFKRNIFGGMKSKLSEGPGPTAFNPKAQELAREVEKIIDGKAMTLATETLLGIPTTAHILGGACMGKGAAEGVIDKNNFVFNYKNMMVCDGSMISANPGVNPSLSITAITERAMSLIPEKKSV
ncbi:MAG: GMC oxidoreductase [Moheibacter sp.]